MSLRPTLETRHAIPTMEGACLKLQKNIAGFRMLWLYRSVRAGPVLAVR